MLQILFVALAVAAAPAPVSATSDSSAPPTQQQMVQTVERSLTFLDKSGTEWWTKTKCASCHHVPMSIWSMTEAKNRGLAVNVESLAQLRDWAVPSYDKHPKLKPVAQDGEEKGLSLNTIYLIQAVTPTEKLDDATTQALKKFALHLLDAQEPDGSWMSSAKLPPVGDNTEVRSMQVLLALATADDRGLVDKARFTAARDRALVWLRGRKFLEQNQSLNLQVLTAKRFGKPADLEPLVKQLLAQQEADGGWSQTKEAPKKDLKEYEEEKPAANATATATKPATEIVKTPKAHLEKSDVPETGDKKGDGKKPAGGPVEAQVRGSDALATGQTIYALIVAGVDPKQPAIQRAQAYLVRTQTKDGSWLVPFRAQKNSGRALSHYGTGWAAIGLMQTLPLSVGAPKTEGFSARTVAVE
ncbi:MAG: hypothetical protein K8U03_20530 [Planctomycetia bacterium]|nr:hypothetical protein [Planctomycetia bacterium]